MDELRGSLDYLLPYSTVCKQPKAIIVDGGGNDFWH